MAGLLGLLDLGAGAIGAQNAGVAVVGRNTANVNTEGYQRESVNLESQLGAPLVGGVVANGALRAEDQLLALRERLAAGADGRAQSMAAASADLEGSLTPTTGDLVQSMARLFGSIGDLASAPSSDALRAQVVAAGGQVASAFQSAAAAISQARSDADERIISLSREASELAERVAEANRALATQMDPVLADQRDLAASKLARLMGGQARIDPDGKMRVVAAGGAVLVDGDRAAAVQTSPDAANGGHVGVQIVDGNHSIDVTGQLDGGQIAGEIAFRDGAAAQAQTDVDQLAFDFASQWNTVHRANAGLDGQTGRDFFVQPAGVSGAAANLAVSSQVAADPRLVAAAAPGTGAGDSAGLAALLALRDQPLAGGGTRTFIDQGIASIGAVGAAAAAAQSESDNTAARVDMFKSARDSVSGVSTQDEMAKLAQFQHASEAAMQFVGVVNDLLTTLMEKV